MFSKYKRKIIYSVIFGALVFLGLSIFASLEDLKEAFASYSWYIFPIILLLSFCNYIARFFKWEYYTNVLGIVINRKMSFIIFLSSFIMSVTPGKVGEVFKSYLLKEYNGTPISKSAPIVLAERITDFLSLVLLSITGGLMLGYGTELIVGFGIFFISLILIISSPKISHSILGLLERIKFLSRFSTRLHLAYDSIYQMVRFKELLVTVFLSLIAWAFECLSFWLIVNSFGIENFIHINIFVATFVYGFSTLAGAATMLPGGLGVTDASMTGLLMLVSLPKSVAVASTLIIRTATLWFAVVVGIFAVFAYQKITHRKLSDNITE
ncbi:MAG: flippase-like domain-containing protein [Ignavibacteria bacterium]|nr:flippase-like domain-containing protein [Ignavibacteria bacterium]